MGEWAVNGEFCSCITNELAFAEYLYYSYYSLRNVHYCSPVAFLESSHKQMTSLKKDKYPPRNRTHYLLSQLEIFPTEVTDVITGVPLRRAHYD
jgi:hypothetical protein